MTLTTDSQLTDSSTSTLCSYVNPTCDLQVIRIINVPNRYFEKVIFPKQRLLFETQPNAELEVYASQQGHTVLVKKIPAVCLQVEQYSFH
ncbi:MAG: DUF1830 domain-containing protein [Cyanobacteriota bacterium]|nr:DUF1830 domain-containing protein [Cyanobacteriota bacterium]